MPLLEIKNLHTFFKTRKGIVKAVNDVSYSVESGKTVGVVGESGSGKSVSAMSILQLLDGNGYIAEGEILFNVERCGRQKIIDLTKCSVDTRKSQESILRKEENLAEKELRRKENAEEKQARKRDIELGKSPEEVKSLADARAAKLAEVRRKRAEELKAIREKRAEQRKFEKSQNAIAQAEENKRRKEENAAEAELVKKENLEEQALRAEEDNSGKSKEEIAKARKERRQALVTKREDRRQALNKLRAERAVVDLDRLSMYDIRGNDISVIFQEPMTSLNPVFSIERQLSEPFIIHQKMSKKQAAKHAVEMLRAVQIPNPEAVVKQYPHQLSGGMRQRVMIAMALACKPKILIADEPTTALDVTIQAQILRLMNDLQRENGTSIIFITHDLGVINEMADDVVVMYCGQVVEKASARVIFSNCKVSHPYTEGLMYSIPRIDNITDRLEPIPGAVPHPLALPKGCKFAPRCKYCTKKCLEEEPPLKEVDKGQLVRCFYPDKEVRSSEQHKKEVVVNK